MVSAFLAGILTGTMLLVAGAAAQTANSLVFETNSAPGLAITLQPGEIVGHEQIVRALLKSGTNEFMFVVPEGLGIQNASEGLILMSSRDRRYYASVRLVEPRPAAAGLKEALQEQIASQYPGVSRWEEFAATVADREGIGAHLTQELPGVAARQVRILWVPFKAGVVEFFLAAQSDNLSTAQGAFDMILLTFRSNERGKLEFVRRSDKS